MTPRLGTDAKVAEAARWLATHRDVAQQPLTRLLRHSFGLNETLAFRAVSEAKRIESSRGECIFQGNDFIGSVAMDGDGFAAFDRSDRYVRRYTSRGDAVEALRQIHTAILIRVGQAK